MTIGIQFEPANLDPTTGGADAAIRSVTDLNIYNGLTRIDESGAVQPDLATKLGRFGRRADLHVPSQGRRQVQ